MFGDSGKQFEASRSITILQTQDILHQRYILSLTDEGGQSQRGKITQHIAQKATELKERIQHIDGLYGMEERVAGSRRFPWTNWASLSVNRSSKTR